MKCPTCGLENPPDAMRCDCGYDFTTRVGKVPEKEDRSRGIGRIIGVALILLLLILALVNFANDADKTTKAINEQFDGRSQHTSESPEATREQERLTTQTNHDSLTDQQIRELLIPSSANAQLRSMGLDECKITAIRRGDPSLSLFIKGAPLGSTIYPIRVTIVCSGNNLITMAASGVRDFYFFQDEFRDWKVVEKPGERDRYIEEMNKLVPSITPP